MSILADSGPDVFNALGDIDEIPDVMCMGGGGYATTTNTYTGPDLMPGTVAYRKVTLSWANGGY